MRLCLVALLLVSPAAASVCGNAKSCLDCDSIVDSDGKQSCSWCSHTTSCVAYSGLECTFGTKIPQASHCPIPVKNGYDYQDSFARKVMWPLSCAAYSDSPSSFIFNEIHGTKLIHEYSVPCDNINKDSCTAYTAVSDYYKANIVSFRGTRGNVQLIIESLESVFSKMVPMTGGGKVSVYFYEAFEALWNNGIFKDLLEMKAANPDYELWITGHSLGGAMASIASGYVAANNFFPSDKIKVMTFGQPRTGNEDYSVAHDAMLPYTYRVTHRKDLVPHLPTEDYRDYYHHRYEVWYNNDMNEGAAYTLCLSPEDGECSDANLLNFSTDDHGHYFEGCIF